MRNHKERGSAVRKKKGQTCQERKNWSTERTNCRLHLFQEPKSSQWFKFSDELVEKIEGKHLKVGSENDCLPSGGRGKKGGGGAGANGSAKVPKGFQVSEDGLHECPAGRNVTIY